MIICPYLGNPDVARDFNELKNATSEAAAYRIWSLNNGNAIDRAPNGAPSKLFQTLLDYYEGDREKAIKAKAKVYKRSFFDWFGDWTSSDKKNVSKVVDENGEPLIVYHGSDAYGFTVFDPSMADDKRSMFFSDSKFIASTYTSFEPLRNSIVRQKLLNNKAIDLIKSKNWESLKNLIEEIIDYSLPLPYRDIKYDPRYSYYIDDEIRKLRDEFHRSGISKEDAMSIQADIQKLEDTMWFSNNYNVSIKEVRSFNQKQPKLVIKINDAWKKDVESSHFIEKGIIFEGTPEQLIDAIQTKTKIYDLFLNIKNPLVLDNQQGEFGASNNWDQVIYEGKIYKTRQISEIAQNGGHDGVLFVDIIDHGGYKGDVDLSPVTDQSIAYDYFHEDEDSYTGRNIYSSNVFVAYTPNQVKSAIDNSEFSTQNDDIFLHVNKKVSGSGNLSDLIEKEGVTTNDIVEDVVSFLSNKFPGLKVHLVDSVDEITREDPIQQNIIKGLLSDKRNSSLVYHGEVYIISSRLQKQGGQIASEEILHMLVKTLQDDNPQLFNQLLEESRKNFKKLTKEIEHIYKEAGQSTIDNEIVTQSLARYVNRGIQSGKHNKFSELVDKFTEWLKSILINSAETIGNFVYIDPTQLKNLTLQELSDLINAEDTKFDINLQHDGIFYHTSQSLNEQILNIYNSIDQDRNQYIDNIVNQYKAANPNAQPADIARIQNQSRIQFDKDRLERTLTDIQTTIASSFGMFNYTQLGYYVAPDTMSEEQKGLYEYIINSLSQQTFERWRDNNNSKYNSVRPDTNVTLNVIHTAIYNGDLSTLDKHLADAYIRMFWNSELVQSGLKLVSDQQISISQREKLLVDAITNENYTSRYNNTTLLDYIANFWNRLKILAQNLFAGRDLSDTAKQAIMTGLTSAYANTRDLEISQGIQVLYDREDGNFDSSKLLSEQDKNILARIKQGTETRLKSQLHRPIQETRLIQELKLQLELLNNKNEDSIEDIYDTIEDFLNKANSEINQTLRYIDQIKNDDIHTWDPIKLNYIKQDLIGFYSGLLKDVRDLFNVNAVSKRKTSVNLYNQAKVANGNIDLEAYAKQLLNDLNNLEEYYYKQTVKPYVHQLLVDFVNSEEGDFIESDKKAQFIKTMEAFLEQDRRYGDLAAGELVLGMASRSRSPIIRIVERMMTKSELARDRRVLKKGQELIRLYNKIRPIGSQQSPFNFQKLFIELDSEDGTTGLPTGYFIRKVNYGRFFREKDEFEAKLREEFASEGVTSVVNSKNGQIETVFPEEDTTLNNSVYNRYMDKLDEWLDKHCNRRYTLEYYKKRRRFLSRQAIEQTRSIQRQIDLIRQKSINELGLEDISTLTRLERQQLNKLYKQKQELSGAYKFTQVNGVLRLEEKVGEEAIIAKQIRDWNKHIQGKVNYKSNEAKYNADLQLMINKYGANSQEVSSFIKDNTKWKISSDFFDELSTTLPKVPQTAEYEDLKERHKQIMNRLVTGNTYYSYDMTLAGTGIRQDTSLWQELARIEQRMSDIRISSGQRLDPNDIPFTMKQIAFGNNQTYLNHIINEWRPEISNNSTLQSVFDSLFTYIDEKGARKYLKAFSYFTPVAASITTSAGNVINTIEKTYSPRYSELDESSEYVNENYDTTNDEVLQPIGYINKQFEKIQKNADYLKFYNLLIDTMQEANSMIPTRALNRSYLMPQITGRGLSILARTSFGSNLFGALGYGVKDAFGLQFLEQDMDASTNLDLPRRPDGTVVSNIPIRYVKRLPQPWLISTDVIGSIMAYYNMAVNYDEKSKNLPSLELINEAINPELSDQSNRMYKQRDKMANLLNFRYYGREDQSLTERKEILHTGKVDWTGVSVKTGKNVRRLASMSMLALNFTTIEVGYIDALLGSIADSVGGKFFTKSDLLYGYSQVLIHLPWMLANLGTPNTNDWMIAAMQYNQLSRSNSDLFEKSDVSRIHKLFVQTQMGGYTIGDYLINSMILAATYRHYRLITDVGTGKQKFMSRSEAIKMFMKYGYTEVEAVNQYESAKTTLRQAYKVVDGVLTLKDEYKNIVTTSLEDRIASRLRDRTAMYNGVIPSVEKAKIQQNVWGSYMTLMRNFYVNTYWERIHTGEDFLSDAEIDSNRQLSMITSDNAGYANFEQGESGNATYVSFLQGIFKYIRNVKRLITHEDLMKLNADQQQAVGRVMTEVGIIFVSAFLMLASIMFARKYDYDEDKDPTLTVDLIDTEKKDHPWWSIVNLDFKNFDEKFLNWARWKFALLSTRVFTERTTFYWPGTIKELISSPTTAISYLDNLEEVFNLWMDLFGINGHDKHEEIKQGGYKGMSRGTRDIMKITSPTGIHNLIRNWRTPGIKSTLNWYQRISPNSFLIPNKADQDKEDKQNGDNTKGKSKRSGKVKAF